MEGLATLLELLIMESDSHLRRMDEARVCSGFRSPSDELHVEYLRGVRAGYERLLKATREDEMP